MTITSYFEHLKSLEESRNVKIIGCIICALAIYVFIAGLLSLLEGNLYLMAWLFISPWVVIQPLISLAKKQEETLYQVKAKFVGEGVIHALYYGMLRYESAIMSGVIQQQTVYIDGEEITHLLPNVRGQKQTTDQLKEVRELLKKGKNVEVKHFFVGTKNKKNIMNDISRTIPICKIN